MVRDMWADPTTDEAFDSAQKDRLRELDALPRNSGWIRRYIVKLLKDWNIPTSSWPDVCNAACLAFYEARDRCLPEVPFEAYAKKAVKNALRDANERRGAGAVTSHSAKDPYFEYVVSDGRRSEWYADHAYDSKGDAISGEALSRLKGAARVFQRWSRTPSQQQTAWLDAMIFRDALDTLYAEDWFAGEVARLRLVEDKTFLWIATRLRAPRKAVRQAMVFAEGFLAASILREEERLRKAHPRVFCLPKPRVFCQIQGPSGTDPEKSSTFFRKSRQKQVVDPYYIGEVRDATAVMRP